MSYGIGYMRLYRIYVVPQQKAPQPQAKILVSALAKLSVQFTKKSQPRYLECDVRCSILP